MEQKRVFIVVTSNETGKEVRLSKGMIRSVTPNADGTSTIHTEHEGSQVVRESADWVEDALKKLV